MQLAMFLVTIAYNESKWTMLRGAEPFPEDKPADVIDLKFGGVALQSRELNEDESFITFKYTETFDYTPLLGVFNLILAIIQLILSSVEFYGMGWKITLYRFWSYLEIASLVLNFTFSLIMIVISATDDDESL